MRVEYGRRRSYAQPGNYQQETARVIAEYWRYRNSGKRRQDKLKRGRRY